MISSSYAEGPTQIDGRRYVTETHVLDDGTEVKFEWLGDGNAQARLEERAVLLQAEYDTREAARLAVVGSRLPLSKFEFLSRLTPQERVGIRTEAKTNPIVEDFLHMLELSAHVERDNPATIAGLNYLVSIGKLEAHRPAEVLA